MKWPIPKFTDELFYISIVASHLSLSILKYDIRYLKNNQLCVKEQCPKGLKLALLAFWFDIGEVSDFK